MAYKKLLLFSIVIGSTMVFFVVCMFTNTEKINHSFLCMILCSIFINIFLYCVGNILLLTITRFPFIVFTIGVIAINLLGYIIVTVCEISHKVCPSNVIMVILGVLVTLILLIVHLIAILFLYSNVYTMEELCLKSEELSKVFSLYQKEVSLYNSKVIKYNKMNGSIQRVSSAIDEEFKYNEINCISENMTIPHYYVGNINMFHCSATTDYFDKIDNFQKEAGKTQKKISKQGVYLDYVLKEKENLLTETERNVERIKTLSSIEGLSKIFKDTTRPAFQLLKKRKLYERKIKSISEGRNHEG